MVTEKGALAPDRERRLDLRNPLIAGPGSVGYGREAAKLVPLDRLGAIITNTTTLHPRSGHAQPRLVEIPSGIITSTGLPNPGLRTVLHRHSTNWGRLGAPVILSLAAEDARTFAYCAEIAQNEETIAALEIEPDLLTPDTDVVRVVDVMRGITSLPLIVHVPVGQPQTVVDAIEDVTAVGCDAVILGSPWPGVVMEMGKHKPLLSGGVSGPATRPQSLRLVYEAAKLLGPQHTPLIAAGGIGSAEDVSAFLSAGAQAVMLESVVYVDPAAVMAMADALSST